MLKASYAVAVEVLKAVIQMLLMLLSSDTFPLYI